VPMGRSFVSAARQRTPEAFSDAGYQLARNLAHFGFVVPAFGMAINTALGLAKNKKSEQASWEQLGKEISSGQYGRALMHYFTKVHQAYMLTGLTGPISNAVGLGLSWTGVSKDKQKDWRNPPVISVLLEPLWNYANAAIQETGGDWSKLPQTLADRHILG